LLSVLLFYFFHLSTFFLLFHLMYYAICLSILFLRFFFFFIYPATTEIYTLSLHDALPIFCGRQYGPVPPFPGSSPPFFTTGRCRSEEHTSELQSRENLVCRLLLEKKKIYERINFR